MYAATNAQVQCVKSLLQSGTDVNTVSWNGYIVQNYERDERVNRVKALVK